MRRAARRGNAAAIRRLRNPHRYPEQLRYLHDWARELFGRSGVGMDGVAPLSEPTLHAWCERTGHRPTELEVQALFALDAVMRAPKESELSDGA